MLREMMETWNLTTEIIITNQFGKSLSNGSWTGMIGNLHRMVSYLSSEGKHGSTIEIFYVIKEYTHDKNVMPLLTKLLLNYLMYSYHYQVTRIKYIIIVIYIFNIIIFVNMYYLCQFSEHKLYIYICITYVH